MFRPNTGHSQQSLVESTQWMDPRVRKKLLESWAPVFYEHVFCKIDEEPFAVLYGKTGNPNFPVNILLSLEYIKHMRDCNDVELLDAFNFDYQVNYAIGLRTLGEMNLARRTLYYFRSRLYQHCLDNPGQDDALFGQFIALLHHFSKEARIAMDEQRADTTLFMSNIKKAGRVALAHDVLAQAVKAIPEGMRTESLSKVLEAGFKNDVLYRMKSQDADRRITMLLGLCQEAMETLDGRPDLAGSGEARVLRRFLTEQSTAEEGTGKRIPKPNKEIQSGSLQSAYDEDATYRKKGNEGQSGYALELSETCGDGNDFQLITDYAVKPNNVSDPEIFEERIPIIKGNTGCRDMYVDGGFHSDGVHEAAAKNGINIHLTNMSGTEPTKKLPVTDFAIDQDSKIIQRCPAGHAPLRAGVSGGQTSAHFPHETCGQCDLRDQCHSKPQKKDCVVRINIKAVDVGRIRADMKNHQMENTGKRAGIEGSNSAMKRKGQDKLAVRGGDRTKIVSALKTTAQNIKRFIKYKLGGYKAKNTSPPLDGILVPISG